MGTKYVVAAAVWLCAAGARAGVCEQVGSSSIPTVVVTPQATGRLEGKYALSNGQRIELLSMNENLYAAFGRYSPVPLKEVERNEFRSPDGAVRLVFVPDRREDQIVLGYPADRRGRFVNAC